MSTRITDRKALNGAYQAMLGLKAFTQAGGIETHLLYLVRMRASQINGCAVCLAMHAKELREIGEQEDRLAVLSAWREAPWFTDRERAALAWTEAVTTLEKHGVPEVVFEHARAVFSEQELVDLTLAVIEINGWNRLNIAFPSSPTPFIIEQKEASAVH